MPRLPILDPSGIQPVGQPRGGVGAPRTPAAPFAQEQSVLAVPRAVAGIGQDVTRAGLIASKLERAQQAAQNSQDILDAEQQAQEFEIAMQSAFAEMVQSGDFRTIPDDVVSQGRGLIEQMRQGLNQHAGQRFETKAVDFLGTLQAKALGVRTARREEQKAFVAQRGIDLHTQGMAEPSDSAEAEYHRAALESMLVDGVKSGLWKGEQAAHLYQQALDNAEALALDKRIRLDPDGELERLKASEETTIGGKPLAEWIDVAQRVSDQSFTRQEQRERAAEADADKADFERYASTIGEFYKMVSAGATAPQLHAWQNTFDRLNADDPFREEDYISGLRISTAFIEAAGRKEINPDPAVQISLIEGIYGPEKTATAQDVIEAMKAGAIDPKSEGIKYLSEIESSVDRNHFSKAFEFDNGYRMLKEAVTGIVGPLDRLADEQNAASLQRWIEAQNVYIEAARTLQSLGTSPIEGKRIVQQRIGEVVRDIIGHYAPHFRALQTSQLPLLRYGIEEVFEKEGIEAAKQRLLESKGLVFSEERIEAVRQGVRQPPPRTVISDVEYQEMVRNLRRREELGWRGGPPEPPPPEDNRNWIRKFFEDLGGGG